jgi:hypothetical protein
MSMLDRFLNDMRMSTPQQPEQCFGKSTVLVFAREQSTFFWWQLLLPS